MNGLHSFPDSRESTRSTSGSPAWGMLEVVEPVEFLVSQGDIVSGSANFLVDISPRDG
jgi:hypothetical protein